MLTAIKLLALLAFTFIWHFLFSFTWWQSLFLGWLICLAGAFLIQIAMQMREIKTHLGLEG